MDDLRLNEDLNFLTDDNETQTCSLNWIKYLASPKKADMLVYIAHKQCIDIRDCLSK